MKHVKIPLNRWVVAVGVMLGLLFGNDAVVALIRPIVDVLSINLPAA